MNSDRPEWSVVQVGDRIIQIEGSALDPDSYPRAVLHQTFNSLGDSATASVQIERHGEELTVQLPIEPLGWSEFVDEDLLLVGIMYVCWLAGFIVITFARPRDARWWLLLAFFLVNSGWVAFGLSGRFGFEWHQFLYEAIVWLSFPVFISLHWIFPQPLYKPKKWFVLCFYAVLFIIYTSLILENNRSYATDPLIGFRPSNIYYWWLQPILVYTYALIGSIIIVIWRYFAFPAQRRQLRLFNITLGSILFFLAVWLIDGYALDTDRLSGTLNLFYIAQISLPLVYVFTIYRQQIERFSLRVNTLVSLYSFVVVVGVLLSIGLALVRSVTPDLSPVTLALLAGITAILATAFGFTPWRTFFEKTILGIPIVPSQLQAEYARLVTTSQSETELVETLQSVVLPSLLIKQSLLTRVNRQAASDPVYAQGVSAVLSDQVVHQLLLSNGDGGVVSADNLSWLRFSVPLKLNNETVGIWLFGHRDPDDIYDPATQKILRAIADQTAIALSNIDQRQSLETLYQLNIEQEEAERQTMALELHDEVLNGLAALMMQVDGDAVSPQFHDMYHQLSGRLRWTIQQLRPPMLNYGIWIALRELAEALESRLESSQTLLYSVPNSDIRFDPQVEQHIYRIVQQALENASRHSQAELIRLHGTIDENGIDLTVEDNGVGFDFDGELHLPDLLANKQFGMVGMMERSSLIGADLEINSAENQGTTINLRWKNPT